MIFLQSAILFICGFTLWITAYITHRIERLTMSTQESIDAVVVKLGAVREEIVAKLADVQAQLDSANVPAEVVDLSGLTAAAQALDDIVPDAPVTPSE
jgi:hypothetical protein